MLILAVCSVHMSTLETALYERTHHRNVDEERDGAGLQGRTGSFGNGDVLGSDIGHLGHDIGHLGHVRTHVASFDRSSHGSGLCGSVLSVDLKQESRGSRH